MKVQFKESYAIPAGCFISKYIKCSLKPYISQGAAQWFHSVLTPLHEYAVFVMLDNVKITDSFFFKKLSKIQNNTLYSRKIGQKLGGRREERGEAVPPVMELVPMWEAGEPFSLAGQKSTRLHNNVRKTFLKKG